MAYAFKLTGNYNAAPLGSALSFAPSLDAPINEALTLVRKTEADKLLSSDAAASVDFNDVVNAHVVILKAEGGKCRARLTSADGSQQAVPVDSALVVISESVPVTAIDLTRSPGVEVTVRYFLGEKA